MPSEMTEFSTELIVWLTLGLLTISLAANTGAVTSHTGLHHQLQGLARYVADNVNVAGSRGVEVSIALPNNLDEHPYAIRAEAYTVLAESEGLRATHPTRYPMAEQKLEPGQSYVIKVGVTMTFQEAGR